MNNAGQLGLHLPGFIYITYHSAYACRQVNIIVNARTFIVESKTIVKERQKKHFYQKI